jgi:hypothetical protein
VWYLQIFISTSSFIIYLESVFDFSGQSIFSTSKFDCIHCRGEDASNRRQDLQGEHHCAAFGYRRVNRGHRHQAARLGGKSCGSAHAWSPANDDRVLCVAAVKFVGPQMQLRHALSRKGYKLAELLITQISIAF